MTEAEFLNTLLEAARANNWVPFHVVDKGHTRRTYAQAQQARKAGDDELARSIMRGGHARVTATGFPDLSLRHARHGILIAELKSDDPASRPTTEQWAWLSAYRKDLAPPDNSYAASRAHLWRPADWPAIETQLGLVTSGQQCQCPVCRDETPPLQSKPRRRQQKR